MKAIVKAVQRFASDEGGVTAIEYGLIATLIGLAALQVMGEVGTALSSKFNEVAQAL